MIVRLSRLLRLVVRCFCDRLRLSRSTIHKMVRMSFKEYVQRPGIFDCSARRLNMLEYRRSPPFNRVCSCDCSRSLRLVVRSSKIACDYRARLVLYRSLKQRTTFSPITWIRGSILMLSSLLALMN